MKRHELTLYGHKYIVYDKEYADTHNIDYIIWWHKFSDLRGKRILTDNNYVVEVVTSTKTQIILPGHSHNRAMPYLFYPMAKNGAFITYLKKHVYGYSRESSYYSKSKLPIELLLQEAFKRTCNFSKAIDIVWGGILTKRDRRRVEQELLNEQRTRKLIMAAIEQLFDEAGVKVSESVKRMNNAANALDKLVDTLINKPDTNVQDALKVIGAAYQLNRQFVDFSNGDGNSAPDETFLLAEPNKE